jgi:predicted secreted protein
MRWLPGVIAAFLPALAMAGDYAERNVIGFSPDGAYFAFVEYGVQDGSGFPYANAYVIATATDSWVKDTPVRVRIDDEAASVATAYAEAMNGIRPVIEQYAIATPAVVLASSPLTEVSTDPHQVAFLLRMPVPPDTSQAFVLTLTETTLPAADCPDMGEPFKGFTLDLRLPDGTTRRLSEDKSIPASRRCPLGYRVSEVLVDPSRTVLAVLIDVMSVGFEGPDRRFLAVTAPTSR